MTRALVGTLSLAQPVPGTALTTSLRVTVGAGDRRAGVANDGYFGIPIRPRATYRASWFARADAGFTGPAPTTCPRAPRP